MVRTLTHGLNSRSNILHRPTMLMLQWSCTVSVVGGGGLEGHMGGGGGLKGHVGGEEDWRGMWEVEED